jgi:hypothetical protein
MHHSCVSMGGPTPCMEHMGLLLHWRLAESVLPYQHQHMRASAAVPVRALRQAEYSLAALLLEPDTCPVELHWQQWEQFCWGFYGRVTCEDVLSGLRVVRECHCLHVCLSEGAVCHTLSLGWGCQNRHQCCLVQCTKCTRQHTRNNAC